MPWRKGNKLRILPEADAEGRSREIYEEIKQALGIPFVPILFQSFGVYPQFLELHWRAVKPVVDAQEFFTFAERLRAESYTRMHNYFEVPDLCARLTDQSYSEGARKELTATIEVFHYVNPLLLLLVAAQLQAFDTPTGSPRPAHRPAQHPVFTERPVLVDEDLAPASTRKIFDDIKRTLVLPFVNSDYRGIARWPDFLVEYWGLLKRMVQTPVYVESQFGVRESAWNFARDLPQMIDLPVSDLADSGIEDEDIAGLVRITELFLRALSGLVLNVALAKIAVEGGTHATSPQDESFKEVKITPPERAA